MVKNIDTKRRASTRAARVVETGSKNDLTGLKDRLLGELLRETHSGALKSRYHWAAEDAAALAFMTPCPALFFPLLLAEKAEAAREWVRRQESIRLRAWGSEGNQNAEMSRSE